MITAHIYNGTNNSIIKQVALDKGLMETVILEAIRKARRMSSPQLPTIHIRDCLGGLRAEVLFRQGKIIVTRN